MGQGKDLAGELIDDWDAPSEEACCSSCSKNPGCQGFAFFEGRCYLKSNVQGTFDKAGCITRVKGALPNPTPASAQCGEFETMLWETDMSGTYLRQVDGVA